MEARILCAALVAAATLSLGANWPQQASVRSEHFIVTAPSAELAKEICQAAERYRRDLAIEWLGHELPPWRGVCPITVRLAAGAGGATSFMFDRGVPFGWTMNIQGSRERLLDSVLPHEITHTIFATHFGRPLPRWADEGACTTVEHPGEKAKQDRFLIEFLQTNRGIPFNQMFAMKEYPHDILPLYSQGYSLTRFLIHQGGKRKFVEYVGEGMQTRNWTAATKKHYGFENLSELQVTWVRWVGEGSPDIATRSIEGLASVEPASANRDEPTDVEQFALARQASAYGWQAPPAQNARAFARARESEQPPAPSNFSASSASPPPGPDTSSVARPVSESGWYARKRDQAQEVRTVSAASSENVIAQPAHVAAPLRAVPGSAQKPGDRRVLMEWRRDDNPAGRPDIRGLAVQEPAPVR